MKAPLSRSLLFLFLPLALLATLPLNAQDQKSPEQKASPEPPRKAPAASSKYAPPSPLPLDRIAGVAGTGSEERSASRSQSDTFTLGSRGDSPEGKLAPYRKGTGDATLTQDAAPDPTAAADELHARPAFGAYSGANGTLLIHGVPGSAFYRLNCESHLSQIAFVRTADPHYYHFNTPKIPGFEWAIAKNPEACSQYAIWYRTSVGPWKFFHIATREVPTRP